MARRMLRPHFEIELDGPIFDEGVSKKVQDIIAGTIEEAGEESVAVMQGFISGAGFVNTGAFLGSVQSKVTRTRGVGYAKVYPTDAWEPGNPGRPTRTWMERGYRGGVRLRKGVWAFRKTAKAVQARDYVTPLAAKIAGAIE